MRRKSKHEELKTRAFGSEVFNGGEDESNDMVKARDQYAARIANGIECISKGVMRKREAGMRSWGSPSSPPEVLAYLRRSITYTTSTS
jgi:hypothetical protein